MPVYAHQLLQSGYGIAILTMAAENQIPYLEVSGMIQYKQLQKRIERDKEKKRLRQLRLHEKYDDPQHVFTMRHFVTAVRKCNKNVSFKRSVQKYNTRAITNIYRDLKSIECGIVPPAASSRKITIRERGHERTITPITIENRIPQRVLCDNSLVPMLGRRLIYDNGASMKNKGVSFSRKRFNEHLEKAKALWGNDFYAFVFDFKSFFDSIHHLVCLYELNRVYADPFLINATMQVIESYQLLDAQITNDVMQQKMIKLHQGCGICLGSQVSQIMALTVPNAIDHFLKDVLGVSFYERYMDDGIIFHHSKELLKQFSDLLNELSKILKLNLNKKKTQIVHIRKGVTFLKIKYVVRNGKTIKKNRKAKHCSNEKKTQKVCAPCGGGKNDVRRCVLFHPELVWSHKVSKIFLCKETNADIV